MGKKNKNSLTENTSKFEEYFKEDLDAIEEELNKSKEYSQIIDSEIRKLSAPALGNNKGSTRYLIDIIENAVALQTQRQGLRKDRVAIKKSIMDYAMKFADDENDSANNSNEIMDALNKLLESDKSSTSKKPLDNKNLDDEIDNILDNDEKESK